jgi:hypothetical protein
MNQEFYDKYKDSSQAVLNLKFTSLCLTGNLEEVAYVLASPDLKVHADIHTRDDIGFIYACQRQDFPLIKYLLSSPNLKEHANINAKDDLALTYACSSDGSLEIVKYLLSSPDLKKHSDLHNGNDAVFKGACANHHLDILQYFIFELKIPKSSSISIYLNDKSYDSEFIEKVNHLFSLRELGQTLQTELPNKLGNKQRIKL